MPADTALRIFTLGRLIRELDTAENLLLFIECVTLFQFKKLEYAAEKGYREFGGFKKV